ncbi:MAG: recombinase family protein [Ginsengibacter sp.]
MYNIGYIRVCKSDGSQAVDLQQDALTAAGIDAARIYKDFASVRKDDRPRLNACLKALQSGNTLVMLAAARARRRMVAVPVR